MAAGRVGPCCTMNHFTVPVVIAGPPSGHVLRVGEELLGSDRRRRTAASGEERPTCTGTTVSAQRNAGVGSAPLKHCEDDAVAGVEAGGRQTIDVWLGGGCPAWGPDATGTGVPKPAEPQL
jgi:hypothetical protein